jgi:hypothetical protein
LTGVAEEQLLPVQQPEDLRKALFGLSQKPVVSEKTFEQLQVSVVNADLREARFPIMVGHFAGAPLINAEASIDKNLKGRLSERKNLGTYPNKIGENALFFHAESHPSMGIVLGLGEADKLTTFGLTTAVEKAVIALAVYYRDRKKEGKEEVINGLSCLLIAVNYGRMPVIESVKAILGGVTNANNIIRNSSPTLTPITNVEFIDFFEEMAVEAYLALNDLSKSDNRLKLDIGRKIEQRMGARKQRVMNSSRTWWHQFTTESIKEKDDKEEKLSGLKFSSSSGLARVETKNVHIGIKQVKLLLEQMSSGKQWDARLSKTLFELLIPNEFKEVIRNQNHLAWKFDIDSAAFPWELFHDSDYDSVPTFVNSGMIRQLYTSDFTSSPRFVNTQKALVVGDPIYNDPGLQQLPGAKKEAEMVADKLDKNAFDVLPMISSNSSDIMLSMFTGLFRIMHFSGHGLYDPENNVSGIAIGDGLTISPQIFDQLPYTPEFVFINCCYSGTINAADDRYYKSRYKLAANIGVQLIQKGVKGVVVAGWAVDDSAAETFAHTFYEQMLQGYRFGNAIQSARKAAYQKHPYTFTWGAYQCYGDPFYSFRSSGYKADIPEEYLLGHQAQQDLDDLLHAVKLGEMTDADALQLLNKIIENVRRNDLECALLIEKYAFIYLELDMPEMALEKFNELLSLNNAQFTVKALELSRYLKARQFINETNTSVNIRQIITETEQLLRIGETRERHCVLGYTYQRAARASMIKNQASTLKYLKQMFEQYSMGRKKCKDIARAKESEAMLSEVLSAIAIQQFEPKTNAHELLEKNIPYYPQYDKKITTILLGSSGVELWLAKARITLIRLLLESDDIKEHVSTIEIAYKNAFRSYLNSRKISEELDYFYYFLRDIPTGNHRTKSQKELQEKKQALLPVIYLLEQFKSES